MIYLNIDFENRYYLLLLDKCMGRMTEEGNLFEVEINLILSFVTLPIYCVLCTHGPAIHNLLLSELSVMTDPGNN